MDIHPGEAVEFVYLFHVSEISSTLAFQVLRSPFLKPQLAHILPSDAPPFLEHPFQLIQIFRFQKIFLGSL